MRDQRTRSTLSTAAIVDAMATGVELARVRISTIVVASSSTSLKTTLKGLLCMEAPGRTTMLVLAVSRPVPRVVAEEAAGGRGEPSSDVVPRQTHYYIKFTGGGRFGFPAAGKAVRRGLEATVNRGLTAAGGLAHRG